jgi:LysR family glycine cleavage system transcriptional activator
VFDVPFPSPVAYYFVCPNGIESLAHVVSFRDWPMAESEQAEKGYR